MPLSSSLALLASGAALRWTEVAALRHPHAWLLLMVAGAVDCAVWLAYCASVGEREARYVSH